MILKLYSTLDQRETINKSKTLLYTFNVKLRADFDILRPSVVLKFSPIEAVHNVNYAELADFGRFYFVDSLKSNNNGLWVLSMSCDVLETYKTQILESEAQYKRNFKAGDFIVDGVKLAEGSISTMHPSNAGFSGTQTMILTTVGEQ